MGRGKTKYFIVWDYAPK